MRGNIILPLAAVLILSACVVTARPGGGLLLIPILPTIVEVDSDNHYAHGGYHYFYTDDRWYYASSRDGERSELPRSHWPRETHRHGWDRPR